MRYLLLWKKGASNKVRRLCFALAASFCFYAMVIFSSSAQNEPANITLDFKDANIQSVLRILAEKGNVNIVSGKDVTGTVTIRLVDVPWDRALDVILKTYGYGYERDGNIILVSSLDKLAQKKKAEEEQKKSDSEFKKIESEQKKAESEQKKAESDIQPVVTEVFVLSYLDANDAKKVIEPQLSSKGKITVVETKGKKGWKFGSVTAGGASTTSGKLERSTEEGEARSKTLIISDIPSYMEKIRLILNEIDVMPKQVLIETKILEVSRNKLKDLGLEWGTGSTGAENETISSTPLRKNNLGETTQAIGAHDLGTQVTPSVFNPQSSGLTPGNTGLKIVYQKLSGMQFEMIMHALEEDADVNTLSNPKVLTLDNQEATILVGTKYPILEANVSGTDVTTTTSTLKYYQDIGIQLNVVPQISGDKYINMIVHPAVTSYTDTLKARSSTGQITAEYPIIQTREAETQIMMKDGETIVIGGLLKDVKSTGKFSVPILGDLPFIGRLFSRETNTVSKIDLLIFITARIVEPNK